MPSRNMFRNDSTDDFPRFSGRLFDCFPDNKKWCTKISCFLGTSPSFFGSNPRFLVPMYHESADLWYITFEGAGRGCLYWVHHVWNHPATWTKECRRSYMWCVHCQTGRNLLRRWHTSSRFGRGDPFRAAIWETCWIRGCTLLSCRILLDVPVPSLPDSPSRPVWTRPSFPV